MARTCGASAAETVVVLSSLRFRLLGFEVRMWRANACPRMIFPPAVNLKRLAAPLWVLSFSLANSILPWIPGMLRISAVKPPPSPKEAERGGPQWRGGGGRAGVPSPGGFLLGLPGRKVAPVGFGSVSPYHP